VAAGGTTPAARWFPLPGMTPSQATISVRERLCLETPPDACALVIFGASGDLARRKLVPALHALHARGLMPRNWYLLGCGRSALDDDAFRALVSDAVGSSSSAHATSVRDDFVRRCFYVSGGYDDAQLYRALAAALATHDRAFATGGNHLFYLSVPPAVYAVVAEGLGAAELAHSAGWVRLAVEKPHGHDLASAHELARRLLHVVQEDQVYRVDHYLGKETVQNILMFRFANAVFEPVWNSTYIDHVQITVAEQLGVGERAGYFDQAGLLRDMFQNHMLQLLALVAMEAPALFDATCLHDEKARVLDAVRLRPEDVVRGQYAAGTVGGVHLKGYRDEQGIAAESRSETYVAARLAIDTPRWRGVPFYLRSGKRLRCRKSEIAVAFKPVARSIFQPLTPRDLTPNLLVFNIQPDEGVALMIQAKKPGPKLCMCDLNLDVSYREAFHTDPPEAYERLLLDCMCGDRSLFLREDIIEKSWSLLAPILAAWAADARIPLHSYAAGSWGPPAAAALLEPSGHAWRDLCAWCKNHDLHRSQPTV